MLTHTPWGQGQNDNFEIDDICCSHLSDCFCNREHTTGPEMLKSWDSSGSFFIIVDVDDRDTQIYSSPSRLTGISLLLFSCGQQLPRIVCDTISVLCVFLKNTSAPHAQFI